MTKAGKGRDFSDMNDMGMGEEAPTVTLTDEQGRSLLCYVEHALEVDGTEYMLLLPVDSPIEIFAWAVDDEDEEVETLVDLADDEVDSVFETAKAVLAEQDLTLKRTAFTLTAAGDLPEIDEEEVITLDLSEEEDGAESEQFQRITFFYHEEQAYDICTPLDPLLFFARRNAQGGADLLSPEEFMAVRSQLEEQLFDALDE
ncbi:DUF3727 domain-containing protein [Leptolyngbya sp. AN02str]|uniref:DUF3727 domain-containing protein n=1 Tax=Leptolyngbya sp. AN02str TaxID=3423363 RepID=UPI003D31C2F5